MPAPQEGINTRTLARAADSPHRSPLDSPQGSPARVIDLAGQSLDSTYVPRQPQLMAPVFCKADPLTVREREVLRWVMEGFSNGDIARVLVVSAETVKTHIGNCLSKLGARDRTQAVVLALRSGQLQLQP